MFRKLAITALLGAASVEAFSPGAVFGTRPALRSPTCRNAKLGLRMQQDTEEYRPIIPTAENPMAPDYAKEPTQFERQGLVESSTNAPVTAMGEGGLTRREALGAGGAVGVGTLALIWAVTRNSGYDKADTSRDAGVAAVNTEAIKAPEVQASIEGLKASAAKLKELQDAFKADPNVQLSESIKGSFKIVAIRDELNKVTFAAFDEDTQIKTDRLVRNIIQDLVELEAASKLKEGADRSPKRVAAVDKWLKQSIGDYGKFLAYFP